MEQMIRAVDLATKVGIPRSKGGILRYLRRWGYRLTFRVDSNSKSRAPLCWLSESDAARFEQQLKDYRAHFYDVVAVEEPPAQDYVPTKEETDAAIQETVQRIRGEQANL